MKSRDALMVVIGTLMTVAAVGEAWAGAGGEGDTPCIVRRQDLGDPPGPKLTGTLSVSADLTTSVADVILRLERTDEIHYFRRSLAATFTAPTLLGAQTKLCEVLAIPGLAGQILSAFHLPGTILVSTPRGIRNTQVVPSVDCAADPRALECKINSLVFEADPSKYRNPDNPQHGLITADVVLFAQ